MSDKQQRVCPSCKHPGYDKGRAFDGRRAYRCQQCGKTWTEGMQGRRKHFSRQRIGNQFADTQCRPKNFQLPRLNKLLKHQDREDLWRRFDSLLKPLV